MFYIKSIEIQNEFTISRSCSVDIHTSLEVDGCSNDTSDCISIDLPQTWELGDDDTLYEELVDDIKVDILATPNELLAWLAEDAGMADSLSDQAKWWCLAERHGWLPDNVEALQESVEGLEELLERTRHELAATKAELEATEAERQALDAELTEHTKAITESNAEACRAFDMVEKLEAEKEAAGHKLTQALALRDQALASVRAERDEALSELVDLRSNIADQCYVGADTTEAGLQAQIEQLRDEVKGRTWQIQQYQQELRIIRTQEQERFTVNDNLRQQERDMRLEWQHRANQLLAQNSELKRQLEQVRAVAEKTLAAFGGE